jgi:hypothetical protein
VGKRLRTCDAAEAVLRETGNPAVMWGDCGLLDLIAGRAGTRETHGRYVRVCPSARHEKVLSALSRQPGRLVGGLVSLPTGRTVRIFWLPECVPETRT